MKKDRAHKKNYKYPILSAIGLFWALAYVCAIYSSSSNPDIAASIRRVNIEIAKLVWLSAGLVAGLVFERREYLRRAWLIYALCPLSYLLYDALYLFEDIHWFRLHTLSIRIVLVWSANVFQTIAVIMLARAWKVAGLDLPGARSKRFLLRMSALALALMLIGASASTSFTNLVKGHMDALIDIAVALGDTIAMIYIAPLLLTYFALRGSYTARPWIFFIIASLAWLVGSAFYLIVSNTDVHQLTMITSVEVFRIFGSWYAFVAGLSQRDVVLKARE